MKLVLCVALACLECATGFSRLGRSNRIVGGEPAKPNEIPFQALLTYFGSLACGASILNENHVITAAHCIDDGASYLSVRAGEYNLSKNDGTEQEREISKIYVHENYGNSDGTHANDIAIIRLATPLVFNDAVRPISLPNEGHISSGMMQTSGWGVHSVDGPSPDVLHKVSVPLVDDETCAASYAEADDHVNGRIMICAGYFGEGGKDSCYGDSGGPLVAYDDGEHLAGIVSWGADCGLPQFPGVYTEVSAYLDWINSIIN